MRYTYQEVSERSCNIYGYTQQPDGHKASKSDPNDVSVHHARTGSLR